jgi:hypothetical protein
VGLTSGGLSGWNTSAHTSFNGYDTTQWAGINVGPDLGLDGHDNPIPITIVTAETAGGGTGGSVPDAASTALLTLFGLSLLIITQRFMGVRAALNQLL